MSKGYGYTVTTDTKGLAVTLVALIDGGRIEVQFVEPDEDSNIASMAKAACTGLQKNAEFFPGEDRAKHAEREVAVNFGKVTVSDEGVPRLHLSMMQAKYIPDEMAAYAVDDQAIEQEIQAKGLNAPRITPDHIASRILGEHYFTAGQGVHGREIDEDGVSDGLSTLPGSPLSLLTFCVLTMRNGFTVTGESACASPENFNA